MLKFQIENSWDKQFKKEFSKDYFKSLVQFVSKQLDSSKTIYPRSQDIFAAFEHTPFDRVRVVILGQDPYHGPGQAHGLSFSVPVGVKPPPSLVNIYKELNSDLGISIPNHGNLQKWADQGVLLLNSVLTVEAEKAASHQGKGWEQFTDEVIRLLNDQREGIVFVLWGSYAQKKGAFIDRSRHLVIESPHPSPLSSYRGFFGSKPFSKINEYLKSKSKSPIDWSLS